MNNIINEKNHRMYKEISNIDYVKSLSKNLRESKSFKTKEFDVFRVTKDCDNNRDNFPELTKE